MFCIRSFFISAAILILSANTLHSKESYFPPPSAINYSDGTLTIIPPDSLPGDPAVLLGYNILVDSIFYDNVMIVNQIDTIYYDFDYATLQPGNHQFCVTAVYNLWISDPLCDSALVVYGYELPFLEDWSSGDFTQNQWFTKSGNWTVETEEGYPGPAAVFSSQPPQYNYEIPLESFAIRADMLHVGTIRLNFGIKLVSINSTGNEKLFVQLYNWNTHTWQDIAMYSNEDGSFDWTSEHINLFNVHSGGPIFKIRFVARGENSVDISKWSVDNIHLERRCLNSTSAEVEEYYDHNILYWSPPTGCYPSGLEWDDGVNYGNSIGTGSEVIFDVAARWDAVQISAYNGERIHAVSFFPDEAQANYKIRIWTGDSAEVLLYEKAVEEIIIGQWNEIELDSLVFIDGEKDLWIGYHIEAQTGYPAGVDDGPAIDGYGNMICWPDGWQSLLEVNPDLDYNWNIKGILHPYPEPPDMRFNIYRKVNLSGSYELLDQTEDWPYEDYDIILANIYCYYVTNLYFSDGDTCESLPTNEACESIYLNFNDNVSSNWIKVYPNPASNIIHIESEEKMNELRIYSVLGEVVMERKMDAREYNLDITAFTNGLYLINIQTDTRRFVEKLMIGK